MCPALRSPPHLVNNVDQFYRKEAAELPAVVVPGLNDDQFSIGRAVHQAVPVIDPPGPETRQIVAQRFGLAGQTEEPW
jgi:hypothetical protein